MAISDLHHQIEALQQQVDILQSAVDNPARFQSILPETVKALQTSLAKLRVADEALYRHNTALDSAHRTTEAARQRYQDLFDAAPDAYLVTDSAGIIQEANRAAAALLATPQHRLVGKPLTIFVSQEEQQAFRQQLAAFDTVPRAWDVRLQPRAGEPFYAALTVAAMRQPHGAGVSLHWLIRDITHRKQVEAVLRDSEARHQVIWQTAVDGIITINERGIVESFNPAAERLFGYTASDVVGQNVRMLMPSPYQEEHDSYIARYLSTGEKKIIGIGREVYGQRQDGTTFPMALAVSEVYVDGRRLFTGIVHDLTARVRAEEALAQLNRRHRLILDSAGEGIYGINLDGRITFVNPAAARMLGWEVEELLGQMIQDSVCHTLRDGTPCSPDTCAMLVACREGVVHHVPENVFWHKDGTSFLVEYISTPIREHGATGGAVVIFRDITERKRLEREMQNADRLALVGQLASGLAHEIGTPLNIIAGNAELLGMDLRERQRDTTEVDAIIRHADRITRLIQQLLSFARAREQSMIALAVQEPLVNALRLIEPRLKHNAITVITKVPSDLPPICGRTEQLEQMFLNVLVNAWHAMPDGGTLTIEAWTTVDLQVRLCVRDTGIGMSDEVLKRVFEPFYSTKGERGTGLGLAICKQILDHHQGTIQLESTPGLGTTVMIQLPQADITTLSPPVFPSSPG
jgi:PAS domain S-box-containing protein